MIMSVTVFSCITSPGNAFMKMRLHTRQAMEAPPTFTVECTHQFATVLHHLEHSGRCVLVVLEVSCRLCLV